MRELAHCMPQRQLHSVRTAHVRLQEDHSYHCDRDHERQPQPRKAVPVRLQLFQPPANSRDVHLDTALLAPERCLDFFSSFFSSHAFDRAIAIRRRSSRDSTALPAPRGSRPLGGHAAAARHRQSSRSHEDHVWVLLPWRRERC